MKITNDVIVNTDNLIKNSELEIVYSGILTQSKEIFINYGYKPNSFEYEKIKLDNNNSVKIKLIQPGYFYFFFTNENDNLDNNSYKDYQLYIKSSNLIITENSSMKELPYRYFYNNNIMYKTFYTSQSIKNTSKPQEIIIPKPFNLNTPTEETKILNGYTLEPVKQIKNYNVSQALIPTENISMVSKINNNNHQSIFTKIKKLLLTIPKLLEKDY